MDDRLPGYVVGITEMFTPRVPLSYTERHRQNKILRDHGRARLKRTKNRRNRRQQELEESIVKSGSEDENEARIERSRRKRKTGKFKKIEKIDKTYLGLNKEKHILHNSSLEEDNRYVNVRRKDKKSKLKTADHTYLGDVPRITFNGPQPNLNNVNGAVKIRTQNKVEKKQRHHDMSATSLKFYNESTRQKTFERPYLIADSNSDSGGYSDEVIRSKARSKRTSILNRAEELLHSRKMRQEVSSGEDGDSEKSMSKEQTFIQRRVDYPTSSDDDKYILVKTTVSPTESEIYTDLDVPLPPLPLHSRHSGKSLPSMTKSEIPVYSDDEFNVYPSQRPHTDTYRDQVFVRGRYEQNKLQDVQNNDDVQTKVHRTLNGKGKRVTFYRNGDKDFKGITISITPKEFLNFESLLIHLNDKIETTSGVRYIFGYPSGKEIKSVTEFQPGRCYLVSSTKKPYLNISYGQSREQFWSNRKPSGGRVRKDEVELFKKPNDFIAMKYSKPRVITVYKNEDRNRKEKIYINPKTEQTFEDLLNTMGDMIEEEIQALYTEKKPYRKVESFNQLFNELKNCDDFIACGAELYPTDKRPAPSSNSGSDSISTISRGKKRFARPNDGAVLNSWADLNEIEENETGLPASPVPNMDYHNGMLTSRDLPLYQHDMKDDSVKFQLKGKDRYYFPPSVMYPDDDGGRPGKKLKLEWVYGYCGKEGSKSLMVYQPTGELLYYIAAVAVFYRCDELCYDSQRHYLGHTDEISCLTIHPNEILVASGQYASKQSPAHIRIWDGRQLTTYHVIGIDMFVHGVASIDFSHKSSGDLMCAIDTSDKHVLTVWDWQREKCVAKTATTNKAVNCACFYKDDDTLLITYGADHLYFWRIFWDQIVEINGRVFNGRLYRDKLSGVFPEGTPKVVTSHAFTLNGDLLTGDSNGSIVVWNRDSEFVFKVNKDQSSIMKCAHNNPVSTLCVMSDNSLLSGGGSIIKSWDSINGFRFMSKREIPPDLAGHVRCIIPQRGTGADGKIYVGTSKSCVLNGSLPIKFRFIINGHSDEVWCEAPVPGELAFVTAGHDQCVMKWSVKSHKLIWRVELDTPLSAIAVDFKGRFVAVGSVSGRFYVLHSKIGKHIITVQCSKARINAMSYSPDCSMLAVGTHDGHIHIFYVYEEGHYYRKNDIVLRGHQSFVTNIDWSGDSKYLKTCDGDFDLIFWNIQRMECEQASCLRDCNWESQTCCADYSMMGPWSSCEDNEGLTVMTRSNFRDIMVVGDNKGRLKLYKYPSSTLSPACRWTKLYSTGVTAVNFLYDDSYILSSAGKYPALAQWSVVDTMISQ